MKLSLKLKTLTAVGLLLGASLAYSPAAATAEESASFFPMTGRITLTNDQGQLVDVYPTAIDASPGARRLITFGGASGVYIIDADTLRTVHNFPPPGSTFEHPSALRVDEATHIAYAGGRAPANGSAGFCSNSSPCVPAIAPIDLMSGARMPTFLFPNSDSGATPARDYTQHSIVALSEPRNGLLFAITQTVGNLAQAHPWTGQVTLHVLDAQTLVSTDAASRAGSLLGSYRLDACGSVPGLTTQQGYIAFHPAERYVAFFCRGSDPAFLSSAVVIDLGDGDPDEYRHTVYPVPADLANGFATGDFAGERLFIVSVPSGSQKLFVFDARRGAWTGALPLGDANIRGAASHPDTGRLYVLDETDGLVVTDPTVVPSKLGETYPIENEDGAPVVLEKTHPVVDTATGRIFVRAARTSDTSSLLVFQDSLPYPKPELPGDPDRLVSTVSGFASAYGARYTQVGGPRNALNDARWPGDDRGVFLGRVLESEVSTTTSKGSGVGVSFDEGSEEDAQPLRPLTSQFAGPAECEDFGGGASTAQSHGAQAACDRAGGIVRVIAASSEHQQESPINVGYGESSTTVQVTGRDVVSRAVAVARHVNIAGAILIDEIRTVAEARASGVPGSAKSTLDVFISKAEVRDSQGKTVYSCGPDSLGGGRECDPAALAASINKTYPARIQAIPPSRVTGVTAASPGGAQALVLEDEYRYWSDRNVMHDTLHEVPGLQVVVYHDRDDTSREVLQLANVRVEARREVERASDPGALELHLVDGSDQPLAGGEFEVYLDSNGDGSIGAGEPATAGSPCRTGADGIGSCRFPSLPAGSYVIRQNTAPLGHSIPDEVEEFTVDVASRRLTSVTVTNLRASAAVEIVLTDEVKGKPLPGATFVLFADNGDGARTASDERLIDCVTDPQGFCGFNDVPLGSYVLTEESAPSGYQPAADIPFTLETPGQVARIGVVNGLAGARVAGRTAEGGAARIEYFDEGDLNPQVSSGPIDDSGGGLGPTIRRFAQVPSEVARFLARNPGQALLFILVWGLIAFPAYLAARRRDLIMTKEFT